MANHTLKSSFVYNRNLPVLRRMLAVVAALVITLSHLGTPVTAETSVLPDLDVIEFRESFVAGSVGNAIVFRVENTTAFPVQGLNLRPQLPAQYLILDSIAPNDLNLDPGQIVEITAEFSVREDAREGAEDVIGFYFDTSSESLLPIPRYRMIAVIEAGEEESQVAECNSAVDAGGDEGGGVSVDLGGFVGLAGFTWEMYSIKDQMNVTVGGITKTTGCVSGSGTFEFDIPAGAGTATVEVVPNCEQTSGTQWNFTFECPLSSEVTADGSGGTTATDDTAADGSSVPGSIAPTGLGAPVAQAPPPPPALGPTGQTAGEVETNDSRANATPVRIGDRIEARIDRRGDADFYRVSLAHQGELTVTFLSMPSELNMAFRVLNDAGHQVWGWQSAPVNGGAFSGWADLKYPGDYFIEVRDGSNDAMSAQRYVMQTTFIPTADPAEVNDTTGTATDTAWNTAIGSNILPRGDVDFFRVVADHQGQLSVTFTDMAAELNMAFRVLNDAGHQVWGWQSAPVAGEPFAAWADLKSPGTYYIEVRDGSNDARSATPYHFYASLDPTLDAGEPNNEIANATPLAPGQPYAANILPRGDVDYYRLDVARQGQMTVHFDTSPDALNMAFRVLNNAGHQVWGWQSSPKQGEPFSGWADLKSPGTYFVEVRDGSNDARSKDAYQIRLAFDATADLAEPNDDIARATALPFGQTLQAAILPRGDPDYYRIDAPRQGELTMTFASAPSNVNMAFRVLNQAGRQVWGWQSAAANGAPFTGWVDLASPGAYFVEVRDGSNDARSAVPYDIVASLIATPDPAEPNNGRDTATTLAMGQTIQASILPRDDADYYRLNLSSGGRLSVVFDDMPANLNMAFRILNAQGRQAHGWQSAPRNGAPFTGGADIDTPGPYFLEVRDGSNDARSAAAYTMRVTLD